MAWEGKMAGAILGGAFGGPLGVVIGAAVGHAVDRMTEKSRQSGSGAEYTYDQQPYGAGSAEGFGPSPQESNNLRVAYGVASFLAYVARADGHFDPLERKLIINISTDLLEKSGGSVHMFKKERWEHLLDEAMRDTGVPKEIIYTARSNSQFRKTLLIFAWRVAARDSRVTKDEVAWISRVAIEMGGSMEEVEYSSTPYYRANGKSGNAAAAAQVLGVSVNASNDEVKSAYRKASLKYHPDRHPTATQREIKELSKKFSEITNAYKVLSEGQRDAQLFALEANTHSIIQPMTGEVVVCFVCGAKSKLPEVHYHSSSRCPKCQALLLHEKEVAQAFAG